ncbi:MAG: putative disulfide formation protein [Candidatus Curtissbacteria bacterium GW2011_GWD1_40_8]|nr:MAG: putative disulfide formation protein [Candidatus Curtissbacteria bacterium GW2011_GWB1_40_28]KKR60591.1 MAG: putative disulfide formation protein [Microgenomates group bacterium GW2011_GWC1_40_35]KKR75248.1 MAG: putative disulfide formation protein [Candidatus Curtissbacteria bacterium GW2011_GWD1_40_8]
MYPIIIILAVGMLRKDKNVVFYVLPMAIIGAAIAFYQYLLQFTPLAEVNPIVCTTVSCEEIQVAYFGFITIPFLSFLGFVAITALMLIKLRTK